MLLFFRKDYDFKPIKTNRFHKIRRSKSGMRKPFQFTNMLFQNDRTRQVEHLTKLVQKGHPTF